MTITMKKYVSWLIFGMLALLLAFNIYKNPFKLIDPYWFSSFEVDSDRLVFGKIIYGRLRPFSPESFFLSGTNYIDGMVPTALNCIVYPAQIGLQGTIFTAVSYIFFFLKLPVIFELTAALTSLFFACILVYIVFWIYKEFNLITAILVFIGIFFSPWITVVGNSPYWALWIDFLPFVVMLHYLSKNQVENACRGKILFLISFLLIFLKAGSGYEYISVVLVMVTLPVIYYAYKNQWSFKTFARCFCITSIGALLGFFAAFIVHFFLIALFYTHDLNSAIDTVMLSPLKRTFIGNSNAYSNEAIIHSFNVSLKEVLETYIVTGIEERPLLNIFGKNIYMKHYVYLLFGGSLLALADRSYTQTMHNNRRKIVGLSLMTLISLVGPISWLVLAKPHSYIHIHITYIIWAMPCTIFITAIIGYTISAIAIDRIRRWKSSL